MASSSPCPTPSPFSEAAQIILREHNTGDTTVSPPCFRLTILCRMKFKFLGLAFHPLYRLAVGSPFPTSSFCHLTQFALADDGFSSGIHILGAGLMEISSECAATQLRSSSSQAKQHLVHLNVKSSLTHYRKPGPYSPNAPTAVSKFSYLSIGPD